MPVFYWTHVVWLFCLPLLAVRVIAHLIFLFFRYSDTFCCFIFICSIIHFLLAAVATPPLCQSTRVTSKTITASAGLLPQTLNYVVLRLPFVSFKKIITGSGSEILGFFCVMFWIKYILHSFLTLYWKSYFSIFLRLIKLSCSELQLIKIMKENLMRSVAAATVTLTEVWTWMNKWSKNSPKEPRLI